LQLPFAVCQSAALLIMLQLLLKARRLLYVARDLLFKYLHVHDGHRDEPF
jgi:hypothetical protein